MGMMAALVEVCFGDYSRDSEGVRKSRIFSRFRENRKPHGFPFGFLRSTTLSAASCLISPVAEHFDNHSWANDLRQCPEIIFVLDTDLAALVGAMGNLHPTPLN
jgi:hypothetical protein